MELVLVTGGTRGDTQPFVALGAGLRDAGYGVTVATHEDFRAMVEARGLGFARMSGSFRGIVESPQGRRWIESAGSFRRYRETCIETFSEWWPRWMDESHAACAQADAIVFHPMYCGAYHTAEKRGIPSICVSTFPTQPSAMLPPLFSPAIPAWGWLRRWLTLKGHDFLGDVILPYHQAHRRRLGLPPLAGPRIWMDMVSWGVPFLHVYSEAIDPRPADWPADCLVTGWCPLAEQAWTPPPALEGFVRAGAPPIYVGFGSMTGRDPAELTALVVDAVARAGLRAVVCTGWGGIDGAALPAHVHRVDDVPHEWLFERVAAVVHHGGVGTTAAGLRAGRPTLVVPFFGDQVYWGHRVFELGAGPRPLPKQKLTAARLAERISELVAEARYGEAARGAQSALLQEQGVARAVDVIARHLGARRAAA